MKRWIALLLAICLCLSLAACSFVAVDVQADETKSTGPTHPKYKDTPLLGGGDSGCSANGGPQE